MVRVIFVLALVAGVPALSYSTARDPDLRRVPRRALYLSAVLSQWLLAVMGLAFVAFVLRSFGAAGFRGLGLESFTGWTLALTLPACAALVGMIALERRGLWPPESELVHLLLPETSGERVWCLLVVAPTAAFCEEFLYRGVLLYQVAEWTRWSGWAVIVASAAFGLAHAYQGLNGMVRAALLGALLAAPVVLTGSLYPSMAAHFLIDAVALVWLGPRMLAPLGPRPAEPAEPSEVDRVDQAEGGDSQA
ncbi:MAG TPA: CPBP family intramembrane glutamic endopeptidase [Terriglobia bacterium]|nr:CPBP family intramembrane glutamic endopeptidase [Terriglobia bacterium]